MKQKVKSSIFAIILAMFLGLFVSVDEARAAEIQPESLDNIEEDVEETEVNTELVFDADATLNRTAAKSALADMHGIFVFRDAFIIQENLVKEAEKKEREQIEKIVLTSKQPDLNCEEWVDIVLKADTGKYIKDVHLKEESNDMFLWIYCIAISICVFCVAIRVDGYFKKKKEEKQIKLPYERFENFILIFIICIPLFTGCGAKEEDKGFTDGIMLALEMEGDVEKALDLENESELWVRTGKLEDNQGKIELFIYERKEQQIIKLDVGMFNGAVNVRNDQKWNYYDVNDDGKKDIVATGTFQVPNSGISKELSMWIFVQTDDNTYEVWEDEGPFTPILKRAGE